jgi:hypothetical protein
MWLLLDVDPSEPSRLAFGLDTRDLSLLLLLLVDDRPSVFVTVVRKREYRILAACPLEMGWIRTGSWAT